MFPDCEGILTDAYLPSSAFDTVGGNSIYHKKYLTIFIKNFSIEIFMWIVCNISHITFVITLLNQGCVEDSVHRA